MSPRANWVTALVFICLYAALAGAAVAVFIYTPGPFVLIALVPIATGAPRCINILAGGKSGTVAR